MGRRDENEATKLASYRELEVWKKAMDLAVAVYHVSVKFPDDERFGMRTQIRDAATSIPSNIAEGYGRHTRGAYLQHLSIANGSLKETETQLILAGRLDFITKEQAKEAWDLLQEVGKMLRSMMLSLKNQ